MTAINRFKSRKVSVIGAGDVGSTFVFALAQSGVAAEITMIDLNTELVKGQVMDLVHGYPFFPPVKIREGSKADYADSQVIVITAGAKQQSGESRLNLLKRNADIVKSIMDDIVNSGSEAIVVMVTNPVDILTYVALKHAGWSRKRIFGSGTVLDSARFRYLISQHCGIDVQNVHAYILGEHGDSELAPWSMAHLAGMKMDDYCAVCKDCGDWDKARQEMEQTVRDSAYHIIDYKGATWFAVGMALVKIVSAVLRDQRSVLTVSTLLKGEYGLEDVCLSVPCIVSSEGIAKVNEVKLRDNEHKALVNSASVLRKTLDDISK